MRFHLYFFFTFQLLTLSYVHEWFQCINTFQIARFSIQPSGEIRTLSALDYETRTSHVILVLGTDGGASARTGTATVTINVQDVEDVIPLFTETNIERSINERQPINTVVVQVTVRTTMECF